MLQAPATRLLYILIYTTTTSPSPTPSAAASSSSPSSLVRVRRQAPRATPQTLLRSHPTEADGAQGLHSPTHGSRRRRRRRRRAAIVRTHWRGKEEGGHLGIGGTGGGQGKPQLERGEEGPTLAAASANSTKAREARELLEEEETEEHLRRRRRRRQLLLAITGLGYHRRKFLSLIASYLKRRDTHRGPLTSAKRTTIGVWGSRRKFVVSSVGGGAGWRLSSDRGRLRSRPHILEYLTTFTA